MKNLLWIKSVIQKKSWYVWLILMIQIVLNVGGVLYAIVFKEITDAAAGGSWLLFRNWVLIFLALAVIQTTLGACNRFATEWARASIENGFKEKLYSSILHKKYAYITGIHSGEWLNRFKIQNYQQAYVLVFEYINAFYNTLRIHSHYQHMSPNDYEKLYTNSRNTTCV